MTRDMPSLNAVRFFECAARHGSFTRAAEELHVTQGAVSRQIKLLEEQLNCQLFVRNGPRVRLTAHGEAFQETVGEAINIIKEGVGHLRRELRSTLKISVVPAFAANWLISRIPVIEAQAPSISLELETSYDAVRFEQRTDIDAAIRIGRGGWPGLYCAQLTKGDMAPVCAPRMASKVSRIEDLNAVRLLVEEPRYDEWESWFAAAGVPFEPVEQREYDDTSMRIQAAMSGVGVSLCRVELIQDLVDAGLLVKLFDVNFRSEQHYFFVCPPARMKEPRIKCLHDVLLELTGTAVN